ncbi:sensor histidine kinase [Flavobacterium granuli]|uniref:sensor histidine kinase n=1 Tax=Flavobacterium granuli TaxID=280093 RepID=UPI00147ECFD9|nr:histidine kinase [Flavobacterium granuli]
MTLITYSKSYQLVFDEKILFYIKLIVSVSTIVSLFGMMLILTQIESAFPTFDYLSVNKLIAIFIEVGVYCLLVTSVSLVLIWGLSRLSWLKQNNLLIVLILFLSLTFLLRLQIRVYDNHFLNSFFDPSTLSGPLLMVVLLYRNKQKKTAFKIKSLANSVSKKEAEYLQLKNQVNPHFLFNNLNTLISFIEINPKKAVEFGHHLSNTYRHYLKNQDDDFVLLKEELEFIKEYLEIYKAKFENGFSFEISALPKENEYILSLSLQEIVDNVFKHNKMDEESPLEIRISTSDDGLLIENSVSNKFSKQSNQVGLENINKRYKILTNKEIDINGSSSMHQVNLPILTLES